jgi:1-deoxy-D-xylulose-5-phosphate synthase
MLREHDLDIPVKTFGLPQQFLDQGERGQILDDLGLAPQHLARAVTEAVARRSSDLARDPRDVVDNREA